MNSDVCGNVCCPEEDTPALKAGLTPNPQDQSLLLPISLNFE